MKVMKKISGMLMLTIMLLFSVSMLTYAAPGSVTFTDLTTPAGEEFVVRMGIRSGGATLGECNIVLNYDNQAIEFISGDSVSASGNKLTYSATGNSDYAATEMTFRALKQGETKITIESCEVKNSSGSVLDVTEGNSTVKVEGGTEVEASVSSEAASGESVDDGAIQVNGVTYTIGTEFKAIDIPSGYSEATVMYNGAEYNGAKSDTAELQLMYLLNDAQEGEFFYFDVETNSFSPYVQVTVSDSTFILFLNTAFDEVLPEQFVETTLTVSGFEFPTWEDTTNKGYYLIHAISSNGEKGAYQYDSAEQTYQRYVIPEIQIVEEVEEDFATTIVVACGDYLQYVVIAIGAIVLLMFLLVIITLVKLRNRNLELDDLYDEIEYNNKAKKPVSKTSQLENKSANKAKSKKKSKKQDEFDSLLLTNSDDMDDEFVNDKNSFQAEFDDDYDALDSGFDLEEIKIPKKNRVRENSTDSTPRRTQNTVRNRDVEISKKVKSSDTSIRNERTRKSEITRDSGISSKNNGARRTEAASQVNEPRRKIRGNAPRKEQTEYIDL